MTISIPLPAWLKVPVPPKPGWMCDDLVSDFVKIALRWEGALDTEYSRYLGGCVSSWMDMGFNAGVKAERERSGLAAALASNVEIHSTETSTGGDSPLDKT